MDLHEMVEAMVDFDLENPGHPPWEAIVRLVREHVDAIEMLDGR